MGKETFPKSGLQRTDGPETQGGRAGKDPRPLYDYQAKMICFQVTFFFFFEEGEWNAVQR